MKKSRARVESLFTGLERAGLATLVALLFVFGIVSVAAARFDQDTTDGSRWWEWIHSYWHRFAGIYADILESFVGFAWFGFVVGLWVDTFLRLRRNPLAVTRNIAAFAACLLVVILLRLPRAAGDFVDIVWHRELWPWWHWYLGSVDDLSDHFLLLAMAVVIIIFGGELSQMARKRMLHAEWVAGQSAPEEERQKWRRREALILAARGPNMPISLAVGRLLILVVTPLCALLSISRIAEDDAYLERQLPAPAMAMNASTAGASRGMGARIWIDPDGLVYLGSAVAAQPRDETCPRLVRLLKRISVRRGETVLLQIHPEVRVQRIIDVMSAADRAGVLLALEE